MSRLAPLLALSAPLLASSAVSASSSSSGICVHVATDGSAPYTSVQAAVDANSGSSSFVTFALSGHFFERVHVYANYTGGVAFTSASSGRTLCADSAASCASPSLVRSFAVGYGDCAHVCGSTPAAGVIEYNVSGAIVGTFNSWSVLVDADDFVAQNVTFINSAAGYDKRVAGQSVALALNGDRATLLSSQVWGAQDTLLATSGRVYARDSYINGSCDSIFGYGAAVLDTCTVAIYDTVTAQKGNGSTAYLFVNSSIVPAQGPNTTYLGRPWGPQAQTVFKNCYMSDAIYPAGWEDWGHGCTNHTSTWCNETVYAEYASWGPGANPAARVWWSYQLDDAQAAGWNVSGVLSGWTPPTGPSAVC